MQALGLNNHLANLDGPNINQIKDKYIGLTARIHRVLARTPDGIATLLLRHDGRFFNCLLAPGFTDSDSLLTALDVTAESLVRVSGEIVSENEPVKHESCSQPTIIRLKTLAVLSGAKADLTQTVASHDFPDTPVSPMEPSAATLDERLDNRLLEARVAANTAIFKLFSGVHELAVGYLAAFNFHYVPTPSLIGYEFPGEEHEQFAVPYFDNQSVWLAQTGEMHLGMALAADLERVYDIHTVFRREELPGPRHLTEFTMLELVFGLEHDWTEILQFAEKMLISIIHFLRECEKYKVLTEATQRLYPAAGIVRLGLNDQGGLLRIRFSEAKKILRDTLGRHSNDQDDLTHDEEAALGTYMRSEDSKIGPPTDLFFITHFPRHLRPYNVHPSPENESETHSFDVIFRGCEICTGCQLLHSHTELRSAMAARKHPIDHDSSQWRPFVKAHDIGMPPWGGFGLGLHRFVQGFLGASDIRDVVLFPRDASRLAP